MIEINIKVNRDNVLDHVDDRGCNLQEVAVALLRLKQIEHRLIKKEYESKFEAKQNE